MLNNEKNIARVMYATDITEMVYNTPLFFTVHACMHAIYTYAES